MASLEANQNVSRIVYMDEESNIIVFERATNIIEIKRKPLVMYCPKCCIPVMTIVNKKVNISGCGNTICEFLTILCLNVALYAITLGILGIRRKGLTKEDGFWKYVHFCPTCRYEIATYKPRVGCMGICGLTLLFVIIPGLILLFVIWAKFIGFDGY